MIPIILSGGGGSRLWPVSRQAFPKQFCELLDESLFAKTAMRLKPFGSPWVITVREMKTVTERAMKSIGGKLDQIIFEPFGNNTAPAVALLCKRMEMLGYGSEVVGVFPADHLVDDESAYQALVQRGVEVASKGEIVTIGIRPTFPATGFGYIETSGLYKQSNDALEAVGFREKPNEETARDFLSSGRFLWNAGMFIFKVDLMIDLFSKHAPDIWTSFTKLEPDLSNLEEIYRSIKSISFDYAIMEKLTRHVTLAGSFGWNDLGTWDSMATVASELPKQRNTVEIESEKNYVFPYGEKTYGLVGVEDLLIIDTADALLVARRGKTELVKQLVDRLKIDGNDKVTEHRFEIRPWGKFEVLADAANYKAKLIEIEPGAQISHQSHAKRNEHWIFLSGEGEVLIGEHAIKVRSNSSVTASAGIKHRISNLGDGRLTFVEVQTGTYFGEDDIIRYKDDYERA